MALEATELLYTIEIFVITSPKQHSSCLFKALFSLYCIRGLWVSSALSPCWVSILLLPSTLFEVKSYARHCFFIFRQQNCPKKLQRSIPPNLGMEDNPTNDKLACRRAFLFLQAWQESRMDNSWKCGNTFRRISCYCFLRHLTAISFSFPLLAPRSFSR